MIYSLYLESGCNHSPRFKSSLATLSRLQFAFFLKVKIYSAAFDVLMGRKVKTATRSLWRQAQWLNEDL